MMEIVKSGKLECVLATLAMISGEDISIIRSIACKAAKVKEWGSTLNNHDAHWAGINAVLETFDIKNFINQQTRSKLYSFKPQIDQGKIDENIIKFNFPFTEKPCLKGKGHLSICFVGKGRRSKTYHSVAFNEGLVYDTSESKPLEFDTWIKTFHRVVCVLGPKT